MKRILTLIFILFVCLSGKAQEVEISGSRKAVRTSGDVLAFVTPVASLTTVLVLQDWKGLKQGALAGVSTIGMTYALKYLIKKERPDGSDKHSFPSMHTSVSFTGAAFIQRRYGWSTLLLIIYIRRNVTAISPLPLCDTSMVTGIEYAS